MEFPLRQYMRCREDLFSGTVHFLLLIAFTVAMVIFARTVDQLFSVHGTDLNPWYRRGVLVLMILLILSLIRRIYRKFVFLRETRVEMHEMREQFQTPPVQDES